VNRQASEERADFAEGVAWVDGEYVPISEAKIPILDWGFLHADVTYDVTHVWQGSFFRLEDHLDRFERSCKALRLSGSPDCDHVRAVLMQCVRLSGLRDAYVEMVCTRGRPAPGSRDPRSCTNTFLAFAVPFVWIFTPEQQERGCHLIVSNVQRIPPESLDPRVKNYHWGDLTRGLFDAYDRGGETVVLVDSKGNITEGPGFNVFAVVGGIIRSPGGTVLEGITKLTVGELCEELGYRIQPGPVAPEELLLADEVFLSSTAGGIMPVTRVDDATIGNGQPGTVTTTLKELYWAKHRQGWHATAVGYDDE